MMKIIALLSCISLVGALSVASKEPVSTGGADACGGMECAQISCPPPFVVKTPDDMGTCCPVCASDIKVPEDRSFANGLSGGIGMNNNADPILCRGVVCLPLDCPEFDQEFDKSSRCCTHCKKGYKPAL